MKKAFLLLILAACCPMAVLAKEKPAPTTTIAATSDQVKAAMVARLASKGYRIDTDTPYQLVVSKEQNGGAGIMTQALAGNARCPMPRHTIRLTLATQSDGVMVVGTQAMQVHQGLTCVPNDIALDGKKNNAEMEKFLAEIKAQVEAPATTASK